MTQFSVYHMNIRRLDKYLINIKGIKPNLDTSKSRKNQATLQKS